jgi:hypothetical protein
MQYDPIALSETIGKTEPGTEPPLRLLWQDSRSRFGLLVLRCHESRQNRHRT